MATPESQMERLALQSELGYKLEELRTLVINVKAERWSTEDTETEENTHENLIVDRGSTVHLV